MALPAVNHRRWPLPYCRGSGVGLPAGNGAGYRHLPADPLAGGAAADVPAADCAAEPGTGAVKTADQNAASARAGLG